MHAAEVEVANAAQPCPRIASSAMHELGSTSSEVPLGIDGGQDSAAHLVPTATPSGVPTRPCMSEHLRPCLDQCRSSRLLPKSTHTQLRFGQFLPRASPAKGSASTSSNNVRVSVWVRVGLA